MDRRRVLVVEDDPAIREGLVDAMEYAGYAALSAGDGLRGTETALAENFDLLLLDLVLPGRDGLEILREVRSAKPTLPVIILTARGEEKDRVRGLKLGADDYVVKPFSVSEVLARIEAVLRRSPERPDAVSRITFPGGYVDLARHEVCYDEGGHAELSERELELLRYLASHAGRALSREEILTRVWGLDPKGITTRTIDMHIVRLREKLRDDPADPCTIRTVRGKGYLFADRDAAT